MRANNASVFRILKPCVLAALAVLMSLMLFGCAGSSQTKSASGSNENGYKEETFNEISFSIPDYLEGDHGETNFEMSDSASTTCVSYDLGKDAKNPVALSIYMQYIAGSDTTAKEWYDTFSEFEECELVSANGIEMCIQHNNPYDPNDASISFSYNNAWYTINVSYQDAKYKDFAENFYKSIRPAGSDVVSSSTEPSSSEQNSSSAIPDGVVEWSKASQYVGKTATFYGKVMDSEYASGSNGKPTFLDVGAAYPDSSRLSVVIWGKNRSAFSSAPESMYKGKTIAVTGEVYRYDGSCNIEVTSPSQIKVIE